MEISCNKTAAALLLILTMIFAQKAHAATTALPDSILNEDYIYKYIYTDRDRSEQIMREMRRREILPLWELDYIEGDLNYNTGRRREALQHYGAALRSRHVQDNDTLQMELLHRQISCYDGLHDESSKMRCVKQLMNVAKKSGHRPMESIALFNMGKSLYYQGDKDRGYHYMQQGADMMASTGYYLKYDNLRYEYKTLVMFYERDGRHEDVLSTLDKWEDIVSESTGKETAIDGLAENEMKDLYAQRAVALSRTGRTAEAEECYRQFRALDNDLAHNNYLIIPYLFDTGQYDEILRINLPREQLLIERQDTVNYYMASVIKTLGHAYRHMGDHRKSSLYFERLAMLRDSLKHREQESAAQDYAALYDSKEKDLLLQKERESNKTAWTIAGCLSVLFACAIGFSLTIIRKNKIIQNKNRTLVNNMEELFAYKDEALSRQKEMMELESHIRQQTDGNHATDHDTESTELQTREELVAEKKRFERIRYEIESKQLFLDKDFNKEELIKDMHIPLSRFSKLFSRYAGKSYSEYMQNLRLIHAARLLHDHPNWTMDAVAEQCCMSLRTFHRLFMKKYGMTPQTYQKEEAERH